jgi:hypothetical protein
VSSAARAALRRLRIRLRLTAAEVYRDVLAQERPGLAFRMVMFAAAVFDRAAASARRVVRGREQVRALGERLAAARVRRRYRGTPVIAAAVVGEPARLSLRLTGPGLPPGRPVLRLTGTAGQVPIDLPTDVSHAGGVLRLSADLPDDAFAVPGARWRVCLATAANAGTVAPVAVVVLDAAALVHRGNASDAWPPRLGTDSDRQLVLSGAAPAAPGIEHRIAVGPASATVSWSTASAEPGELQLERSDGGGRQVVAASSTGPADRHAVIDLTALAAGDSGVWQTSVRRGHSGAWERVAARRGEYPALGTVADVLLRRPDGEVAAVRVGYSPANRLTFAVGPVR